MYACTFSASATCVLTYRREPAGPSARGRSAQGVLRGTSIERCIYIEYIICIENRKYIPLSIDKDTRGFCARYN